MTQSEINKYRAMAALGILEDELNPLFIMNNVRAELLVQIVNGNIDPVEMARMEMRDRGLDLKTGKWIGWKSEAGKHMPAQQRA